MIISARLQEDYIAEVLWLGPLVSRATINRNDSFRMNAERVALFLWVAVDAHLYFNESAIEWGKASCSLNGL